MCLPSAGSQLASGWRLERCPNPRTSFRPCCHSRSIPFDAPPLKRALGSQIIDNEEVLTSAARQILERMFIESLLTHRAWDCLCLSLVTVAPSPRQQREPAFLSASERSTRQANPKRPWFWLSVVAVVESLRLPLAASRPRRGPLLFRAVRRVRALGLGSAPTFQVLVRFDSLPWPSSAL